MVSKEFEVKNPTGIHARPASMLTELCSKLPEEITILTEDGKTVQVEGENEQESLDKIMELLESFEE